MNPWAIWLDPWGAYLDAWSKALGDNIFRLHGSADAPEITLRKSANPFRIALEGDNFALLDFSRDDKKASSSPTIIVTPFALHDWRLADLAHRHSLVEILLDHKVAPLYVLAWKSAHFTTRHNRIDSQFKALKCVSDNFAAPIQIVGLCQGGWLSLAYTARFPEAISRLALIGAPIDFRLSKTTISTMDDHLIDASINWLALAGGGVIRGWSTQSLWQIKFGDGSDRCKALQETDADIRRDTGLCRAYEEWDRDVLDLPPAYFGDVLKHLYRDNEIFEGRFKVLGEYVSLKSVSCPILIMIGRDDEIVPEHQIRAVEKSVSTPKSRIAILHAKCGHLALFVGRNTLHEQWPKIAHWLCNGSLEKAH